MNNLKNSRLLNQKLSKFKIKSPVAFVFHLNWRMFENFKLSHYQYIEKNFKLRGINLSLLPIMTDTNSHFDRRMDQFKNQIERLCDENNSKCSIVAYSMAGILPRAYVSINDGEDCIDTILTIGTPHNGSRIADLLYEDYEKQNLKYIEPALNGLGANLEWFTHEYRTVQMNEFNKTLSDSENVKYLSVGGSRQQIKCSDGLRFSHDLLSMEDDDEYHSCDGLISNKEAKHGDHLINFDADHFELIGLRRDFRACDLFDFYANSIKYNHPEFKNYRMEEEKNYERKTIINTVL